MRRITRACVLDRTPSQEWLEKEEWQTPCESRVSITVESTNDSALLFFYEGGMLFHLGRKGKVGFGEE